MKQRRHMIDMTKPRRSMIGDIRADVTMRVLDGLRVGMPLDMLASMPGVPAVDAQAGTTYILQTIDPVVPDDLAWRWSIQRAILVDAPFGFPRVMRDVEWPPISPTPEPTPTPDDLMWASTWAGLNPHHRRAMELLAHCARMTKT